MAEYLATDGYVTYIWSAWGIAATLMLAIWGLSIRELRYQAALLAEMEAAEKNDR